ncbi:HNH endonuclease signature motif containing protein [Mesorhizobium sp. B2-4-6]|uniref:HNH endonuclease n=1 Tax=Mesorhizobium sp. B2-4-6 TaxID=2589943 RepID=UPI00112A5504|nr:HNH endonuclease signature motif containing protein [Mesorhizobium sp. B2-4-6]TPL49891.1 HNH endonuclease [Mesorhizobium sp. B2-4-6]
MMPQFWWVNHSQTARQEIDGQYLWSPKTERNGALSEFYKNMRRATPGDLVLSYFDQAVRYVGRVTEFAFTAPKPEEFKNTGAYWNQEGWLLPVYWTPLEPTVSPKTMIGELGPLLPARYSPIHPVSGSGNQKAYLAGISSEVFHAIVASAAFNREGLTRGGANSLTFEVVNEILEDTVGRRILEDLQLEDTVKNSVIQARRGQGKFRANVEAVEEACRLTGITNPSLLIASHIKPWRLCTSAQERLDGMNGLLLTPDADHLFDRGFISFEDSGEVRVSSRVDRADLQRLGFDQLVMQSFGFSEAPAVWRTGAFNAMQQGYLAHHRADVFVA